MYCTSSQCELNSGGSVLQNQRSGLSCVHIHFEHCYKLLYKYPTSFDQQEYCEALKGYHHIMGSYYASSHLYQRLGFPTCYSCDNLTFQWLSSEDAPLRFSIIVLWHIYRHCRHHWSHDSQWKPTCTQLSCVLHEANCQRSQLGEIFWSAQNQEGLGSKQGLSLGIVVPICRRTSLLCPRKKIEIPFLNVYLLVMKFPMHAPK